MDKNPSDTVILSGFPVLKKKSINNKNKVSLKGLRYPFLRILSPHQLDME